MNFIESRVTALENRLARIESLLGLNPLRAIAPPPIPAAPRPVPLQAPVTPQIVHPVPPPIPRSAHPHKIEQTIGLKWTGWVGAIVLVIGAALGIQYAYQHQWFILISPILRLLAFFSAGLALIVAGEIVFRKINPIAAASLFGAGIAILFIAGYVGYAFFNIYTPNVSMILMACAALIGAAVALRGNLLSTAVISLLGANLAPILLATPNSPLNPFLCYLLAMQLVALALAGVGAGEKWWVLRGLSLAPTFLWVAALLLSHHHHDPALLIFMLCSAGLYHAESILTLARCEFHTVGSAFALWVTAALAAGLLTFYDQQTPGFRADCLLLLAFFSLTLGLLLPKFNQSLRNLAVAHRIAAAALIVVAVPIGFHGLRVEIAWLLLACAFSLFWKIARSAIARYAALITWFLGIGHLCLAFTGQIPSEPAGLGSIWFTFASTPIYSTTLIAWMFAVAGQAIAAFLTAPARPARETDEIQWLHAARVLSFLSGALFSIAACTGLPHLQATVAILIYAWLIAAEAAVIPSHLNLNTECAASLITAAVKWIAYDAVTARLADDWSHYTPLLNNLIAVAAAIVVSLLLFPRLRRKSADDLVTDFLDILAAGLITLIPLIACSLEIDRAFSRPTHFADARLAGQVALSIFWALYAVGALSLGFLRRIAPLRYFALFLLAITLSKVVIIDMSQVAYGYRILSFLGLGMLMLITSIMYGKISPKLLHTPPPAIP